MRALILGLCFVANLAAADPFVGPPPPPEAARCTPDGQHCIWRQRYIPHVCETLAKAAARSQIDPHFFARLIWRESLFDANAVSHAGAQGIAQFMPATARIEGLADPFNPAEALFASANHLRDLADSFGNLGLAAAGYNAGAGRVTRFVEQGVRLPGETRAYVAAITGFRATAWRDETPEPDYRLDGETPFHVACAARAKSRSIRAFAPAPPEGIPPWGVVLAAHRSRDITAFRLQRLQRRLPETVTALAPVYVRASLPGIRGRQFTAQYGADSEAEARKLCRQIVRAGVPCLVHRN